MSQALFHSGGILGTVTVLVKSILFWLYRERLRIDEISSSTVNGSDWLRLMLKVRSTSVSSETGKSSAQFFEFYAFSEFSRHYLSVIKPFLLKIQAGS